MLEQKSVVIAGCGEIGKPIFQLARGGFDDVLVEDPLFPKPEAPRHDVLALHIALPGSLPNFEGLVAEYAHKYRPDVVLVHATTTPGVTDRLAEAVGLDVVVHAQVHGKHAAHRMRRDMLFYPKFVATSSDVAFARACAALAPLGHPPDQIRRLGSPLAGELSKLLATTYFGFLVAWAQETERLAAAANVDFDDLMAFAELDTPDFHIRGKFPGVIGGHCVMPNIEILRESFPSPFWELIRDSNDRKEAQLDG